MRWLVCVFAVACMGCTGDNPAFQRDVRAGDDGSSGGDDTSGGSQPDEDSGEPACEGIDPGEALEVQFMPTLGPECGALTNFFGQMSEVGEGRYNFGCVAGCGSDCEVQGELRFMNFPPNVPPMVGCAHVFVQTTADCMVETLSIIDFDRNLTLIQGGRAPTFLEPIHSFAFGTSYNGVETCECTQGCCDLEPGRYSLSWTAFGALDQGQVEIVEADGNFYELINMRSHVPAECAEPNFDWIMHPAP